MSPKLWIEASIDFKIHAALQDPPFSVFVCLIVEYQVKFGSWSDFDRNAIF